jgi:glycosyltransferase involved in cell wall biosynthesis
LANDGHDVTLVGPEPAKSTATLLEGLGVTTQGWGAHFEPASAAGSFVALANAVAPLDVIVLPRSLASIAPHVASIAPSARVELNDEMPPAPLPNCRRPPRSLRAGICVVADTRNLSEHGRHNLQVIAALIAERDYLAPVVVLGDAAAQRPDFPGALDIGPQADPTGWLGAARVVVIASGNEPTTWRRLASACGTPAVELPADAPLDDDLVDTVAGLLDALSKAPAVEIDEEPARSPAIAAPRDERPTAAAIHWRLDESAALPGPGSGPLSIEVDWPYRGVPAEWIGPLRDRAACCAVACEQERSQLVAAGVPAVRVVVKEPPLDKDIFSAAGQARVLHTPKQARLLYSGPLDEHGGLDALLESWLCWFDARTDACLVVAPAGTSAEDAGLLEAVRVAAGAKGAAVELVDPPDGAHERARLYRSCQVLVSPARDDSQLETVREARACGLDCVVLEGTAAAELAGEKNSWVVRATELPVEVPGLTPIGGRFVWHEPSRSDLARVLRHVIARRSPTASAADARGPSPNHRDGQKENS